jgi:hypothetical protein
MNESYRSEVELFITMALAAGYTLVGVCDGEAIQYYLSVAETLDTVCSVDESSISFVKDKCRYTIYCIAGNGPGEAIADYNTSADGEASAAFDNLHSEWMEATEVVH